MLPPTTGEDNYCTARLN